MAFRHPAICMIGDPRDVNLVYLALRARTRGFCVIELAEARLGTDWDFGCDDGNVHAGRIDLAAKQIDAEEVAGFFVRLKPRRGVSGEGFGFDGERRHRLEHWLDSIPGVVINRPHAGHLAGAEHQQLARLAQAGFDVPAVVHRYIPGKDVRVQAVADQAFATEIGSAGIDYRFSAETGAYRAHALPEPLAELCCRVAARERLWLATFDFRVTPAGEWVCVGMDAEPNFMLCERSTGQPIADAILDLFEARSLVITDARAPQALLAAAG